MNDVWIPRWLMEQARFFEKLGIDPDEFIQEAIEHSLVPKAGEGE